MSPSLGEEPLGRLTFDPLNPRLPRSVDGTNMSEVLGWMLKDATILELMASIGAHGFFAGEPLLVAPREGDPDTLVVVEGNRRLAATLLLTNPELAPTKRRAVAAVVEAAEHRPIEVACVRFDEREDILDFLGYRHITGIKEWSPLAKARYLEQLWAEHSEIEEQERLRTLARMIGSKSDYVARLLTALHLYDLMEARSFFEVEGLSEDTVDFSFLIVALNRRNVVNFLELKSGQDYRLRNLNEANFEWLAKWMFRKDDQGRTVLGESRHFGDLAQVVAKPEAVAALQAGVPLAQAVQLTEHPTQVFRNAVSDARGRLTTALAYAERAEEADDRDVTALTDAMRLARESRTVLEARLGGD